MNGTKRLLIIGSGKRVRETAFPALHRASSAFVVQRVFARTKKSIDVGAKRYDVEPIAALDARVLADADLVYVAVGKDAVPQVLAHLVALDASRVDLLIDTPVVRFKHFRHTALLARFRNAWVAEDCAYLPWFDTIRAACERGAIGELERVVFHRSAYAYHGLASAKTLFASDSIVRGRRTRTANGTALRALELRGGGRVEIVEPRDYSVGYIVLQSQRGIASDHTAVNASAIAFEALARGDRCLGFRIGDVETKLDDDEVELARGDHAEASITARMEAMKRVGFLRLLRAIAERRGAYPIAAGIDDMVVDYYLEKLGFWRSNALTNPRATLGRTLLETVSRFGGG
jgi:hypothetical protein